MELSPKSWEKWTVWKWSTLLTIYSGDPCHFFPISIDWSKLSSMGTHSVGAYRLVFAVVAPDWTFSLPIVSRVQQILLWNVQRNAVPNVVIRTQASVSSYKTAHGLGRKRSQRITTNVRVAALSKPSLPICRRWNNTHKGILNHANTAIKVSLESTVLVFASTGITKNFIIFSFFLLVNSFCNWSQQPAPSFPIF